MNDFLTISGAGLAGSEAAWQAAERGVPVVLYEMRSVNRTAAHKTDNCAELVCSNSLGNNLPHSAPYILKEELRNFILKEEKKILQDLGWKSALITIGAMFGISTKSTTSIEEIGQLTKGPKLFQLYIHKDRGLTDNLLERCKKAGFTSMCLTVDTVVAGNRERDRRTGFTTPPKLTLGSLLSFALHPGWTINHLIHEKFKLANIIHMTQKGTSIDKSVIDYINEQFDPAMNWKDAEYCVKKWNGPFALKGVMSVEDAKKAIDIGCTAIMISNHGGRQLDGSRAPLDQLSEIVDAVGDKIEVILDG